MTWRAIALGQLRGIPDPRLHGARCCLVKTCGWLSRTADAAVAGRYPQAGFAIRRSVCRPDGEGIRDPPHVFREEVDKDSDKDSDKVKNLGQSALIRLA